MAAGVAATVASLWFAMNVDVGVAATRYALSLAISVPLTTLILAIGNVARLRFFSREDIDAAVGTSPTLPVRRASAVLQNTLEQAVLAIGTYALLALARPGSAGSLIALATLFAVGRSLFWWGYARGAASRALGFALTFYPSVGAFGVAALSIIAGVLSRSA